LEGKESQDGKPIERPAPTNANPITSETREVRDGDSEKSRELERDDSKPVNN
jgi:hypothetical protein